MNTSPPIQMLRRHTSRAALLQNRRRNIRPSSTARPARYGDAHQAAHRHQRRHYLATPSPFAQPQTFVTGVTSQQLAENKAVQEWYAANFKDWEEEPDKIIIGANEEEEAKAKEAAAAEEQENPSIIQLPEHLTKRNIRPLVAYLRKPGIEEGTRNCNRLRHPRVTDPDFPLIPGMLHGSDPTKNIVSVDRSSKIMVKTPWFEIQRELSRYHYGLNGSFENRVYALTVFPSDEASLLHHRTRHPKDRTTYRIDDDTTEIITIPGAPLPTPPPRTPVEGMENILVIPADLQMHPVSYTTYCLNYIRYHPGKPIKIPIRLVNEEESNTLKRGGFLGLVNRFVECLVEDGAPIPECIGLECSGLQKKDVVRRDRLIVPEGVRIHPRVPEDYLMGTVYGVRSGAELDAEGEGAAEEGGEAK